MSEAEVRAAYRDAVEKLEAQDARLAKLEAELAALLAHRGRGGGGGSGGLTPEQLRQRERERRARLEERRKKRRAQRATDGPRRRGRRSARTRSADRTLVARVDRATVPADARPVGYATRIVQEIAFDRDNVRVRRERLYSPTAGWITAAPPAGFENDFGPQLRAFVARLYWGCNVSRQRPGLC